MSRGPSALIGYLGLGVLVLVVLFGLLAVIFGLGDITNPIHAVYNALLHAMDPGTIGGDSTDSPTYVILQLLLTFGGIIIFSAFIGVLATAVDERLQQLRKGRSLVLESGHTLILGWSETIFTVISELAIANENERNPSIVVLADHDKVEMEDAIRDKVEDLRGTRVVCRTGSPIDLRDLAIVAPDSARSIIVLSPDEDEPDASVIKTILALTRGPQRRPEPYHIVAEIQDASNLEAARLVGGDEAVLIDKSDTVARLIVQTARQSGAAVVYTELLDFDGDEVYFRTDPALEGRTYAEAQHHYEACCVIGIQSQAGTRLNPPADTIIEPGAALIAIAEDDAMLDAASGTSAEIDESVILPAQPRSSEPAHTIILGANSRTGTVLRELDEYVDPGSTVLVVGDPAPNEQRIEHDSGTLRNLTVTVQHGNTSDRATLEALDLGRFDHAMVMCPGDHLDPQRADARTLVTLLHLRDIVDATGAQLSVVSEMLDDRNRELAQVTKVDDVIVSDQVISLLLSQISENPDLAAVFDDLFDAEGSEVYLRSASEYVATGTNVTFATLVAAASRRNETAIGYRVAAAQGEPGSGGVIVNPAKGARFDIAPGDRLIVLAEE
jgi:voltage-gated potassium channel Kch